MDVNVILNISKGKSYTLNGPHDDFAITGLQRSKGWYEPHVGKVMEAVVADDGVCLDIGANYGIHTLLLSSLARNGEVHAFEPAQRNRIYLERNLRVNNCGNVKIHPFAMTAENGIARLNFPDGHGGAAHLGHHEDTGLTRTENVQCTTLDSWIAAEKLDRLDLIKMDIEGAETAAVRGGRASLSELRPDLIVEYNPQAIMRSPPHDFLTLWNELFAIYPSIFLITEFGSLLRIQNQNHLQHLLQNGRGLEDLYCTFRAGRLGISNSYAEQIRFFLKSTKRKLFARNCIVLRPDYVMSSQSAKLSGKPGALIDVPVKLENHSTVSFSSRYKNPILISYHIRRVNEMIVFDGLRTALPYDLDPGQTLHAVMRVQLPQHEGQYSLQMSLVQEQVSWFYNLNRNLIFTVDLSVF